VEVVVLVLCTKVAEAAGALVVSDTTTTVVDVLYKVPLGGGRVGRFVVGMMVEMFASVDACERTMDVGPVGEQLRVRLKPTVPTTKLQVVTLGGDAAGVLDAASGLPVFVVPRARVELLARAGGCRTLANDVVSTSALFSGSGQDTVTVVVTMMLLGYAGMTLVRLGFGSNIAVVGVTVVVVVTV
jgi:hypothetical protein